MAGVAYDALAVGVLVHPIRLREQGLAQLSDRSIMFFEPASYLLADRISYPVAG